MNYKTKFFIIGLVLLVFISISTVSASENATDVVSYDDGNDELESQAVIYADDYNSIYDSGKQISVKVKDDYGNSLDDVDVAISYNTGDFWSDYTDEYRNVYFDVYKSVGSYKANIFINDGSYDADTVQINVKVSKTPVKLTASKINSKTNQYTTLKAIVKDKWGYSVNQGSVKFTVNGKSYSVKVKNGVATKKIKLTKAKTYTYKASFTAKNYQSKTVSSKVIVKKPAKQYAFKKAGYTFKVSQAQYKKIQYVKNHKHSKKLSTYANFKVKTDKTRYGYPVYAVVTTWSGIQNGKYLNYPQVQFIVTYGSSYESEWDYLTVHYKI